jgi:hypothetical protein
MKITTGVTKYTAEQTLAGDVALDRGLKEKARKFADKGSELYAKA